MVIDCCPRCASEGRLKYCKESGEKSIRFVNFDYWKEFFTSAKEPYVLACESCNRLFFVSWWSLLVSFAVEVLFTPWLLNPAIFSDSFAVAALAWIALLLVTVFSTRLTFLLPWKEIERSEYPKMKRRYRWLSGLICFVGLAVSLGLAFLLRR